LVFWIILALILLLPFFEGIFFSVETTEDWLKSFDEEQFIDEDSIVWKMEKIVIEDSLLFKEENRNKKDSIVLKKVKNDNDSINSIEEDIEKLPKYDINWVWSDYDGFNHQISFKVLKRDVYKAINYRENYSYGLAYSIIYPNFVKISNPVIDSMVKAMKMDMDKKQIRGNDMLNYVVTAIQTPRYTLLYDKCEYMFGIDFINDCRPRADGRGCCENIYPFGLFTPAEFILQKTGDCDTKSLVAYALLKKLGFNAAMLVGDTERGPHAMLGLTNVVPSIPSKYVLYKGRIYYPWEVTEKWDGFQLGNMKMWRGWLNWNVVCN
jgi:hypothetical protein